jgi:hypothetical protein
MSLTQMDRAFIENFSKYSRTLSKSTQGGEYSVSIKSNCIKESRGQKRRQATNDYPLLAKRLGVLISFHAEQFAVFGFQITKLPTYPITKWSHGWILQTIARR